ncbi:hypothetical protein HO173_011901 [Letharia columbiana]|uniref:BZIP domain-containing protein n=1 Tax=Letharia columbiana TaxID=112416 RepID=A0A8H6CQU2_9LECA|nr:uncharacterized protein HO173_011901 [Letharia columbiana]KAF6227799.1 hypothetical protein HO173_011901 [Letharia columbiana]
MAALIATLFQLTHPTNSTPLNPSDLPTQEYLNLPSASRIRTGSRFTATIPLHDHQSFVTDTPQKWLSQPQSPRLPTPATNTISFSNQDSDFVLFPSTPTAHTPSTTRRNTDFVPATPRTVPNQHLGQTYNGQQQYQPRRNSTQQFSPSVSPVQNLRVSGIIQGTRSLSSSPSMQQFNSPTGQQLRFYANSAPSSTTGLHQQSPRTRPPVPLFSNSTGNIHQQNLSTMALSHNFEDVPSDNMFDFTNADFTAAPDSDNILFDGSLDFGTHFEPINDPAPAQTSNLQTVSPKDLMVDSMSAPPSGAFTDLTTPGTSAYDSPYMANSTETSPLFAEESFADDPEKWPSLFDPIEEETNTGPVSHFAGASPSPTYTAPKMSRNDSSPGQSSSRSSHQGRHSFTSGVAPKRRDKPLPAITIEDPNDTVAMKRARNTMAARKSREKRVERTEQLVGQVTQLEADVDYWKKIAIGMGHVE